MERLTYWNEEYGCWSYKCASGDAAKMLAAYEDTGLTPKQIEGMKVIIKQYDQDRIAAQQECGSICEDAIKMHQQIQAQQQEIARIKRQLNCERQTVSMLKSFGLHYGEFPRLEADKLIDKLVADKDEQAKRIMQLETALKCLHDLLEEHEPVWYLRKHHNIAIDALLGGAEE